MSKLTDIKYRIDQLDGGAFQNLCDAYLACKCYGVGYSLGMDTGTDKTAKGNPDTYFLQANGRYVFVMYTTQKDGFVKKALEDLQKCFNVAKTKLPAEEVAEIVYCHTCGRILAGDDKQLREFCKARNATLTLIGLDELGNDLYLNYPRLAKDFLGISVDSGQITSMQEFLRIHDANQTAAPLETPFQFRETELNAAKEKLSRCDVLVISGPAGVGKTRLALQICEEMSQNNEILCIKSNGLELYEDLVASIDDKKNYVIFVDDANELTGLHFVLDLLPKSADKHACRIKIIISVRDYARQQVINTILEVTKPEVLKVDLLKDDDIRKLLATTYGIENPLYLDRIVRIAEGNARLAMLAGKVAADANALDSIRDATELYAHYYGKQIEQILNRGTIIRSAGIMAFFQVLRLDYLTKLRPIFDTAGLTEEQFISDIKSLHELELVDLCHDKAARISDQSFSNYLIKYTCVDKRFLSLSQIIKIGFGINQAKTISACNVLLRVFSDRDVQDYVEEQINIVWDELRPNAEQFFRFFQSFFIVRPTESLSLINDLIEQEQQRLFDIKSIEFNRTQPEKSIEDSIISILCGFKHNEQLATAIDLLLRYYQKRPDLFEQVFSALAFQLCIDKISEMLDYYTQNTVVQRLCSMLENTPTEENMILFVRVAEEYLKLSYFRIEGSKRHTITYYTLPMMPHETLSKYRKCLIDKLCNIYAGGNCCSEIESLFMDYCRVSVDGEEYEIVKEELPNILMIFQFLSPENLYQCMLAEHINEVAQKAQYDIGDELTPFLQSKKYLVFDMLTSHRMKMRDLGYHEYQEYHRAQIKRITSGYEVNDVRYLMQVCRECLDTADQDGHLLSFGIRYFFEAIAGNQELFIAAVKEYINVDTPYEISVGAILQSLFTMMPPENVKDLILSQDFAQQNVWLWSFYEEMPAEQISVVWANDFLAYLETIPDHLRSSPYRSLDSVAEKYSSVDKDIFLKACRVITAHFHESPFVFGLYSFYQMNSDNSAEARMIIEKFKQDLPLLEDFYLKSISVSEHEDHKGVLLAEIFKEDPQFLYKYIEQIVKNRSGRYSLDHPWTHRLMFIWTDNRFTTYMDLIADYCANATCDTVWSIYSIISQLLLHEKGRTEIEEKQDVWIEQAIEKHISNDDYIVGLFSAIEGHGFERRKRAIRKFLELSKDYSLFERLPIDTTSCGGFGSMIPHMQQRIVFLESILPFASGLDYLKHRQRIERYIEMWKKQIKNEEIHELIESMG